MVVNGGLLIVFYVKMFYVLTPETPLVTMPWQYFNIYYKYRSQHQEQISS